MELASSNLLMSFMIGNVISLGEAISVSRKEYDDNLQRLDERKCPEIYSTAHPQITENSNQVDNADYHG